LGIALPSSREEDYKFLAILLFSGFICLVFFEHFEILLAQT